MNDRELMELAARACGYDTSHPWNAERLALDPPVDALCIDGVSTGWNPLTNDGHALRLAVKLRISIEMDEQYAFGVADRESGLGMCECWNNDPYAATRRAIVRAAAAIGEKME